MAETKASGQGLVPGIAAVGHCHLHPHLHEVKLSAASGIQWPPSHGHRIASGVTETNYTDFGKVSNRYHVVTAVNENGESDPSNEAQDSEPCGSAMAMTLPTLNAATLTETGGDPMITKYYFHAGKRVAMDRDGVVQYLVGDHLGTTSLVLNADGTVHSEARHYPYGEERWSSGTLPTDYRFTGQRVEQSRSGCQISANKET